MLYFAYGANLCKSLMHRRCPDSVPVGTGRLEGFRLVFRGTADLEPSPGDAVLGAVWQMTHTDFQSLELFENVPGGLYHRDQAMALMDDTQRLCLVSVYRRTGGELMPPEFDYLAALYRGYEDFGLDDSRLRQAVALAG